MQGITYTNNDFDTLVQQSSVSIKNLWKQCQKESKAAPQNDELIASCWLLGCAYYYKKLDESPIDVRHIQRLEQEYLTFYINNDISNIITALGKKLVSYYCKKEGFSHNVAALAQKLQSYYFKKIDSFDENSSISQSSEKDEFSSLYWYYCLLIKKCEHMAVISENALKNSQQYELGSFHKATAISYIKSFEQTPLIPENYELLYDIYQLARYHNQHTICPQELDDTFHKLDTVLTGIEHPQEYSRDTQHFSTTHYGNHYSHHADIEEWFNPNPAPGFNAQAWCRFTHSTHSVTDSVPDHTQQDAPPIRALSPPQ